MFGWLRKKDKEPLVFESNVAAFDYACRQLPNAILLEADIPALVEENGEVGQEGEHYFRLRLADKSGGREIWGCTLKEATDYPEAGDFVGFRIVKIASDLPEGMNILGFISVKLAPILVEKKGWKIERSFTPKNIKPVVRF